MAKEDIYTSFVEAEQDFLDIYRELMYKEEVSALKNDIIDSKMYILTKNFESILFEIEMYKNGQKEKYSQKFKLLILLILISTIILIFNPLIGIGGSLLATIGFFKLRNNAIADIEHLNLNHVIDIINKKLKSLEELKGILKIKNQKREIRLQRERINSGRSCLTIDLANAALGNYLTTLEIPQMNDEVRWVLIQMLQEDFHTKETNLECLLDLAYERTPVNVLMDGYNLTRKK